MAHSVSKYWHQTAIYTENEILVTQNQQTTGFSLKGQDKKSGLQDLRYQIIGTYFSSNSGIGKKSAVMSTWHMLCNRFRMLAFTWNACANCSICNYAVIDLIIRIVSTATNTVAKLIFQNHSGLKAEPFQDFFSTIGQFQDLSGPEIFKTHFYDFRRTDETMH